MTTRLLIAYGLIAAFALGGFAWLWFGVLRARFARNRYHRRAEKARRAALADHPA